MSDGLSHHDLEIDWSMLPRDGSEWTNEDLQLAAELGNTLLERNKELEKNLKQHQNIIEDQAQEIEYLNKQTAALREVNDSRLRIYEQLEVSIQDLERANHRLVLDNSHDKKQIKTLCQTIETLEGKCDELQKSVDDLSRQLESQRRREQRSLELTEEQSHENVRPRLRTFSGNKSISEENQPLSLLRTTEIQCNTSTSDRTPSRNVFDADDEGMVNLDPGDEVTQLLNELLDERVQRTRDHRRTVELEEEMASLLQENQSLEQQLSEYHRKDDMKSIHEEINTLEEVREGHLCAKCLRKMDERARDELSMLLDQDCSAYEDDCVQSINNSNINKFPFRSAIDIQIEDSHASNADIETLSHTEKINPYRVLVEKYEALLEVKRQPINRLPKKPPPKCLSLQEELQISGDFNSLSTKDTDDESGHGGDGFKRTAPNKSKNMRKDQKLFSRTPTDFSEAETSSSGFSDETSNKATQTDSLRPGSFLCTIADGEDCKFSIYDDASPIDSRFRNHPEYRELFKEIFTVLKKAAENKDEGEQLPLLDDEITVCNVPKVPPVTPATEELPLDLSEDCQSMVSLTNSEMSTSVLDTSEPVSVSKEPVETPEIAQQPEPKAQEPQQKREERVLTPYKREPLEYLSVAVHVRKKSSSRKNGLRKQTAADRSESPVLPLSPKILYSSRPWNRAPNRQTTKQRDFKPLETPARALNESTSIWNGSSMQFWSSHRNSASPTPSQGSGPWEFHPSTASQDLHKLKRLDVTYAEVLRNADNNKTYSKVISRRK